MKRSLWILPLVVFLAGPALSLAAQPADKKADSEKAQPAKTDSKTEKSETKQAFLGVGMAPMRRELANQNESLADGRGVLVAEVVTDSPAEKAGLKAGDILIGFDDQKLFAPEQLAKLVQNDKPGREVSLEVVHAGKSEKVKATLGEQPAASAAREHRVFRQPLDPGQRPMTAEEREAQWTTFDSMTISRVDQSHFKAEIKYRDKQGKVETRNFKGTRDELHRDISGEKDLPTTERDNLLRALDLTSGSTESSQGSSRS